MIEFIIAIMAVIVLPNMLLWMLTGENTFKMLSKYFTRYKIVEVKSGVFIPFFLLFGNNDIQFPNLTGKFGWYPLHKCSDTKIQLNNREYGGLNMASVDSMLKAYDIINLSKAQRDFLVKKFKRKTTYV